MVLAATGAAQIVTYTWITSGDSNFNNTANWSGGVVPPSSGNTRLFLPSGPGTEVITLPTGAFTLDSLQLGANNPGVSYQFSTGGATTLTISPWTLPSPTPGA